jgi:regulatory protein YycI of two-component signal transduction system YycFG
MDKSIYGTFSLTKSAVIDGKNVKVGGITNTSICGAIEKNDKISNTSDKALALSVYDILINADIEAGSKPTQKPWGLTGKEFLTKTTANYGLVIIYTSDGDIPFAQIYHNGILVTYAYGEYVANDSKDAKFIKLGQSFSDPFVQAGKNKSELNSKILNSKFPSNW